MGQAPFFSKRQPRGSTWGEASPLCTPPARELRPVNPVRTMILAPFGSGLGSALRYLFEVAADLFFRATKSP